MLYIKQVGSHHYGSWLMIKTERCILNQKSLSLSIYGFSNIFQSTDSVAVYPQTIVGFVYVP